MGIFDQLVPGIAAKFGIPTSAAHSAVALVFKAHQGDAAAVDHVTKISQGQSDRLKAILGAAYGAMRAHPSFWVAHYASKAKANPLPSTHPYAAPISSALSAVSRAASAVAGRGRGGGPGHGGHRAHGRQRGRSFTVAPAIITESPWYYPGDGSEALFDEQQATDQTANAQDLGPEWGDGKSGSGIYGN
jgi:hypothetical protein